MEKEKLLICECNDVEHQIIFRYDDTDNVAYMSVHLVKKPFFTRLKNGFKYIFGHKSIYGDFDEVIIGKRYASFLKELGEKLENGKRDC